MRELQTMLSDRESKVTSLQYEVEMQQEAVQYWKSRQCHDELGRLTQEYRRVTEMLSQAQMHLAKEAFSNNKVIQDLE
jgi:hypothetical protein